MGKGYDTEALNALLNWAKKNISRQYIISFAPTQNVASQRVMEKCGMALYKTDIAHGVECKFYKIKNTPIKERSCNTMTRNMIIRETAMADKAAFIQDMQRSQALYLPWVVSPQTEEKFDEYIQSSQKANQKYFLACNAVGNIVGVFNISEIVLGAFQSAYLGFYSVENYAGQRCLKLVLRNIFEEIKLRRIEANIQA